MEKYGEIPKKFTKDWWEYIWDYYKVHIIVALFILFLSSLLLSECVFREKYDISMILAGEKQLSDLELDNMNKYLSGSILDVDGNEEKKVFTRQLDFSQTSEANLNPQHQLAVVATYMSEISLGESLVYILSEDLVLEQIELGNIEALFLPVDEWLSSSVSNDDLLYYNDSAYAVHLDESAYFNNAGIDMSSMYVAILKPHSENDNTEKSKFLSSVNAANSLVLR